MRRQMFIVLTVLLVIVGILVLLLPDSDDRLRTVAFDTADAYNSARAEGGIPGNAPGLPACAEGITVDSKEGSVFGLSFLCSNTGERDAFVEDMRAGFAWDILVFDGEKVALEATTE